MSSFSLWHWVVVLGALFVAALPFLLIGLIIWLIIRAFRKPRATASAMGVRTAEARIGELDRMRSQGLITDAEYSEKKAEILKSL